VRTGLRQPLHQIGARQHADHPPRLDHREVMLKSREHARERALQGVGGGGRVAASVSKRVIIARLTGMPPRTDRMSAALASDAAPIHTNNAMNTRNGLPNRPTRPNTSASP